MTTQQQRACPQRVSVATLSAWRDGELSASEAERLRPHIADCVVCQQTIAAYTTLGRALQRNMVEGQHEASRRQDRLWRALRARILWQPGGQWMNNTQTRIWRGVGAVAIAVVVAVVAFQLLGGHVPHVAQKPRATATATKQQTPAPLDPAIARLPTLTQAWGTHAITYSIPIGANSTHDPVFRPADIAPNGAVIVGYGYNDNQVVPSSIMMLIMATSKMQQLANVTYSTAGFETVYSTGIVKTDGRYVAWLNQAAAGWQIGVYDTQHGTQTTFQTAQSTGEIFLLVGVDQGQLFWIDQHNSGRKSFALKETDLATQTTTDIVPQANFSYFNAVESWPYVFYSDVTGTSANPSTSIGAFLYDLTTHKQLALPTTQANNGYVLAGSTLYRQEGNAAGNVASLEVDQIQHADQAGATWQKLLTLPWTDNTTTASTGLAAANDRLLIFDRDYASAPFNLIAWDMKQQRFILVEPALSSLVGIVVLHNDWLAYLSIDTATTYTLHVINTAQLP